MATIFTKIMSKEIPAKIVHEDELCLAFQDIDPQAPVHVLLIPRKEIASMNEVTPEDAPILGHLMAQVPVVAKKLGLTDYRLVVNTGPASGQTVYHIHIHMLGGRDFRWPPG